MVDDPRLQQTRNGPFEQRAPVEFAERFWDTGAQSLAQPRGRDDCNNCAPDHQSSGPSGSGGQNLIEDDVSFSLVGAFGQGQFTDENLTGLCQHALLACGQAALLVAAPQVAHYLCDLVDVTGGKLLQVGLV